MAKKSPFVLPKPQEMSKADLQNAADDARTVTRESKIVQTMLVTMIESRRIYMLARSALDNELKDGWDLDNPALIVETLVMSAQDKANEKFELVDTQRNILQGIVPFLDILIQQEKETGQGIFDKPESEDADESGSEGNDINDGTDTSAAAVTDADDGSNVGSEDES